MTPRREHRGKLCKFHIFFTSGSGKYDPEIPICFAIGISSSM